MAGSDDLVRLRSKYDSVIRTAQGLGVRIEKSEMQGDKFLLKGEAPSDDAKNKVWDEIKRVAGGYGDLVADIRVKPGAAPAAGVGGPAAANVTAPGGRTYTVKKGDTLSKIAKEHYGDANQYRKIFEANRDQLKDPDKIQPGQVLKIPQ